MYIHKYQIESDISNFSEIERLKLYYQGCKDFSFGYVAKTFLTLIDRHFPKDKKLSKIFDRNNKTQIELSTQCCTDNLQ